MQRGKNALMDRRWVITPIRAKRSKIMTGAICNNLTAATEELYVSTLL